MSDFPVLEFTLSDYERLELGMDYEDVAETLGGDGLLLSANVAQLEPGFTICSMTTEVYEWRNAAGGAVRVMFGEDGLRDVSQHGLD